MSSVRFVLEFDWVDPLWVLEGLHERAGVAGLVAGGGDVTAHGGRWSYVGCEPQALQVFDKTDHLFAVLDDEAWRDVPVIGLVSYDAGARAATGWRAHVWPDLVLGRYRALLVFDHLARKVYAQGVAADRHKAQQFAKQAAQWLHEAQRPDPSLNTVAPSQSFEDLTGAKAYAEAVANVVELIGKGELFQANIARTWMGRLHQGRDPFEVFRRLSVRSGAAYGAFWRMDDRALVSNSPELFLSFEAQQKRLEARPIKGTRPRGADVQSDTALAAELLASAKDRAENLMIVDLMRNDLARVSQAGTVKVETLYGLEAHPTVHHLTSVVTGRAREDVRAADILAATFPPGSITGAPKHQAMKVIAALEGPRGVWCGSLFGIGLRNDGDLVASVLIRTASFQRAQAVWHWQTMAGAGITADSEPQAEILETEAKISALREGLFITDSPDS